MKDIFTNIEQQIENIDAKIEGLVKNATDAKNYEKINEKINDMVNNSSAIFDKGYAKAEKVVKEQSTRLKSAYEIQQERLKEQSQSFKVPPVANVAIPPKKDTPNKKLYANKDGYYSGGMAMTIVGFILAGLLAIGMFALAVLGSVFLGSVFNLVNTFVLMPLAAIFSIMACMGIIMMERVKRFKKYQRALNGNSQVEIKYLAASVNKSSLFVRKDVVKMINSNWFKEGRLSADRSSLITSHNSYLEYQSNKENEVKAINLAKERELVFSQLPEEAKNIINTGEGFILKINENKEKIKDEDMKAKLLMLEMVLKKIFSRAKKHTEVVPQMRRMVEYYLPTTVKLLEAYTQLDKQTITGTNIVSAKSEIEASLDTLIAAYEKLLDDLFVDVMLDVSTDISVLNTMLAQDGLKNDKFGNING